MYSVLVLAYREYVVPIVGASGVSSSSSIRRHPKYLCAVPDVAQHLLGRNCMYVHTYIGTPY